MWLTLVILSFATISVVLFVLSAIFWFPIWRKYQSGPAQGLVLTNVTMAIAIIFRVARMITDLTRDGFCEQTYSLLISVLVLAVSVFQFALSRGYFNLRGENNERD